MKQHLSCNDALATLAALGVEVRVLAWMDRDVIALQIMDKRPHPAPLAVHLRMLRPALSRDLNQTATG